MPILSKRIQSDVSRSCAARFGVKPRFTDISGTAVGTVDVPAVLSNTRRRRSYALQESINLGAPYFFCVAPSVVTWVMGLEHRRMVHGGVLGGEVVVADPGPLVRSGLRGDRADTLAYLARHGMAADGAERFLASLPVWPADRVREAAAFLQETFYAVSGWQPELMEENRLRAQQQEQVNRAIEDQRRAGGVALYAFEKERMLLANIRAGDRSGARSILNEMLATIYMSTPQVVVLRARAIELMSCLTRAAIEDNPLMEPLIERNHRWTERLVRAASFEQLSQDLMDALDDFIDGIYLHGVNRSNPRVRRALDFISEHFAEPISLQAVAGEVGLSGCRLAHLVNEFTGRTVGQIIQDVRIQHAQHLLERTERSCTEIAYDVGFGDQSYFTKQFRRRTGITPAKYRRARCGR